MPGAATGRQRGLARFGELAGKALDAGRDVARAGFGGWSPALLRAELSTAHRVRARIAAAALLPTGGTGIELGVFTGLFSTVLLDVARPRTAYFVDCWWLGFGESYPDWGRYTAHGRLATRTAHAAATRRIRRHAHGADCRVVAADGLAFLAGLPPAHLDWAYLDTGHGYAQTRDELRALRSRLKPGAVLLGDDWNDDPAHPHHGVARAVREAVSGGSYGGLTLLPHAQWLVRVPG